MLYARNGSIEYFLHTLRRGLSDKYYLCAHRIIHTSIVMDQLFCRIRLLSSVWHGVNRRTSNKRFQSFRLRFLGADPLALQPSQHIEIGERRCGNRKD